MSKRISIWGVVVLVGVVAFVTFQSLRRADGASSDRVTFKSKSGDLVQFLRDELVKYGGSVTFTSAVPSLRIEWRYAEDVKGFQILLAQSHREEFIRCLTVAFGEPLRRKQYPQLVYKEDRFGVGIVANLESDPIHVICIKKAASPLGQTTTQTKGDKTSAFTANELEHSPFFSELKRRSKHATFVVDADTPDSVVVAIGEDMDTHFTWFKTLKIDKATGAIARLETDQSLEDKWQVEFQPNK